MVDEVQQSAIGEGFEGKEGLLVCEMTTWIVDAPFAEITLYLTNHVCCVCGL